MSCDVGLGMWSRYGMCSVTRVAKRNVWWCDAHVKSITWWREKVHTEQAGLW